MIAGAHTRPSGPSQRITVSQLMYDTDIILGLTWLKTVNPIVDWRSRKLYVPNALNTSLILGEWMDEQVKIGTVQALSNENGLQKLKDRGLKEKIAVLKSPKFWTEIYDGVKIRGRICPRGMHNVKILVKMNLIVREMWRIVTRSRNLVHYLFGLIQFLDHCILRDYVIMLPFQNEEQKILLDMT